MGVGRGGVARGQAHPVAASRSATAAPPAGREPHLHTQTSPQSTSSSLIESPSWVAASIVVGTIDAGIAASFTDHVVTLVVGSVTTVAGNAGVGAPVPVMVTSTVAPGSQKPQIAERAGADCSTMWSL